MDISKTTAKLKQEPGFTEKVGMLLVHNGVVRGWSRKDGAAVGEIQVRPDRSRIEQLRAEAFAKTAASNAAPGVFRVAFAFLCLGDVFDDSGGGGVFLITEISNTK